MDRREFTALLGAGALFPGELLAKATTQPSLPKGIADDDHIQHYPIYYMRTGSKDVYKLWQPGIVMGVCDPSGWRVTSSTVTKRLVRIYCKGPPPGRYLFLKREEELRNAILNAPAHGLIKDDGFGRPYTYNPDCVSYQVRDFVEPWKVLHISDAESLAADGHLCRCQPFCTYEEYLERNFLEKTI